MEQEHVSFGCCIVSSVTVKFAVVLLCACFIFTNNVHSVWQLHVSFLLHPIYTGCMGKHFIFVLCEKVLETLIEDVLASGICFCLCIVNLVQSLRG
jgi:hypothetical protein